MQRATDFLFVTRSRVAGEAWRGFSGDRPRILHFCIHTVRSRRASHGASGMANVPGSRTCVDSAPTPLPPLMCRGVRKNQHSTLVCTTARTSGQPCRRLWKMTVAAPPRCSVDGRPKDSVCPLELGPKLRASRQSHDGRHRHAKQQGRRTVGSCDLLVTAAGSTATAIPK